MQRQGWRSLYGATGPIASIELVRLAHSEIGRSKPTTFTYFRMLMEKGLAKNERSSVTMLFTRDEIVA